MGGGIGEELECVREQTMQRRQKRQWALTEDISVHLLEKRWCDTVSRCRKEKIFRLTSRHPPYENNLLYDIMIR